MGMFDSFYDADGNEWQTKAYNNLLDVYRVGDEPPGPPNTYQVEIYGGVANMDAGDAYATIVGGVITSFPDERNERLPRMDYHGYLWVRPGDAS